jgi:hypothetical protein
LLQLSRAHRFVAFLGFPHLVSVLIPFVIFSTDSSFCRLGRDVLITPCFTSNPFPGWGLVAVIYKSWDCVEVGVPFGGTVEPIKNPTSLEASD